jgi:hypothetical protein
LTNLLLLTSSNESILQPPFATRSLLALLQGLYQVDLLFGVILSCLVIVRGDMIPVTDLPPDDVERITNRNLFGNLFRRRSLCVDP